MEFRCAEWLGMLSSCDCEGIRYVWAVRIHSRDPIRRATSLWQRSTRLRLKQHSSFHILTRVHDVDYIKSKSLELTFATTTNNTTAHLLTSTRVPIHAVARVLLHVDCRPHTSELSCRNTCARTFQDRPPTVQNTFRMPPGQLHVV